MREHPAQPDLVIVIVAYNSADALGALLDGLPAALGGLIADTIVVDNGSSDGTAEFVAAHGGCRLVRSTNVGYAGGINRGVRAARRAEAILALNADVRLREGSIPLLMKALDEPGVGIVAPQIRSPDGKLQQSLRRAPSLPRELGLTRTKLPVFSEFVYENSAYDRPCSVDWALGAVLLMSRDCYDLLGGWDESFFLYSEETDFSLRAGDAGLLTWYEPEAVAVHIGGHSGRNGTTRSMQVINRVRLYRRRHSIVASWVYYAITLLHEIAWVIRGFPDSRSAVVALLRPSRRPPELGLAAKVMPL